MNGHLPALATTPDPGPANHGDLHQGLLGAGLATLAVMVVLGLTPILAQGAADQPTTLAAQNEILFRQLQQIHSLRVEQMNALQEIFNASRYLGQGNPQISRHPATPQQCQARLEEAGVNYENPGFERICGDRYMAPAYDPSRQGPEDGGTCIDQFEFPNIPCAYPVVWVRAREAAQICEVLGKRLCDAHEWEGACQGNLQEPDYRFDLAAGQAPAAAIRRMREAHNRVHFQDKAWSYGKEYQKGICSAASAKTPGCEGGGWSQCGSNTYPAGFSPQCRSPLGVYDLNGNAAEHMSLPLEPAEMASRGSREYGHTEMKGSWFIFDSYRAHEDWCRWRAPYWHGSRVMDRQSHHNYHLGFRCCKTLDRN